MKVSALILGGAFLMAGNGEAQKRSIDRLAGTYKVHLYFGDKEPFLDELALKIDEGGNLSGRMHVPGDFDAEIEDIATDKPSLLEVKITFRISLPERYHQTLAKDLYYDLRFRDHETGFEDRFIGFVTHCKFAERDKTYLGSIVGFRKKD